MAINIIHHTYDCIFSGYVPLTLGSNCNNKSGAGQCLSLVKCARVWRILFADRIVSASYKFWKGNSEMHHLWKKRQGITRRHRKACPASRECVTHCPACLPSFPNPSLVLMATSEAGVSDLVKVAFSDSV